MSVDTYAVCPCGSGKKIKFCKCKDSVHEMDRVMKMVEGGQIVPAMDQLSTLLAEHPDAAWALAIRGRLQISLREHEALAENAERFIRLQPSNPLALTQRAAACLFKDDIPKATESLLNALTESGRDVDAFLLDVAGMLSLALAQSGNYLSALEYARLGAVAEGYDGSQASMAVLKQVHGSPNVNQLIKSLVEFVERPTDVEWLERYDEASGLLQSNKVSLAQSKLESLQRVAPFEPAVLQGLLVCAVWRGDAEKQSDLYKKLSQCESLDDLIRARCLAMSALVEPGTPQLSLPTHKLQAEIQDAEQVQIAMDAESRLVPLPNQMVQQMRESEESVPPRAGYQLLDRDPPESLETLPPVDEVPEAKSIVFLYGKTTDRPARIDILDVAASDSDEIKSLISKVADGATVTEADGEAMPLLLAAQPQAAMIRYQGKPADAEKLQNDMSVKRIPQRVMSLALPILGGKSLTEVVDDDSKQLEKMAAVLIFANFDGLVSRCPGLVAKLQELAKIESTPPMKLTDDDLQNITPEELGNLDLSELSAPGLLYVMQRAQQVSSTNCMRDAAKALLEADLADDQKVLKVYAYTHLVESSNSIEERLELLDAAMKYSEEHNIPAPGLLLNELPLRLQAGDTEGFQRTLQTISTKHGNDPNVMGQLQQLLMSLGLIRPDGSPRQGPSPGVAGPEAAPAAGGSELWTPDGGGSSPPPDSSEGGSKLWVPGMD